MAINVSLAHNIIVSLLCGLCYGYNSGIISGLSRSLVVCDFFPAHGPDGSLLPELNKLQSIYRGILTADVLVGGMLGSFIGVPLADRFGRTKALAVSSCFGCCAIFLGFIDDFSLHVLIRVIIGLCIGAYCTLCPLYLTETIPADMRGQVGTVFQISICFSIFCAQFINWASKRDYDATSNDVNKFCIAPSVWKTELMIGMIPSSILFLYALIFLPETENWINYRRQRDRFDSSAASPAPALSTHLLTSSASDERQRDYTPLSSDDDARLEEDEYDFDAIEIQSPVANHQIISWKDFLCTGTGLHWTRLSLGLAMTSQLTGINVVIYYSPQIFKDANIKNELVATFLVVGLWNFLSVFVATIVVDKVGRRPLMLAGLSGMTIAAAMLGSVFGVITNTSLRSGVAISAILLFVFGFEIGPGGLFFLLASESFPSQVRGKALTLANVTAWFMNILVSFGFPIALKIIGSTVTFFILSLVGLASVIFTFLSLPETKGINTER